MNDLLNMLITLLDAKDAQGVANVDFQFGKILEMISPKKIMEDPAGPQGNPVYLWEIYGVR